MLLTRQQLEDRLFALHRASLQLVEDISLETLLERIAAVERYRISSDARDPETRRRTMDKVCGERIG